MKTRKPFFVKQASISPKEPVTWAGPGRVPGEICLGYETGKIGFFDATLAMTRGTSPVFGCGEPINGAAFLGSLAVVTTCEEMFIYQALGGTIRQVSHPSGAHGVIAGGLRTIVAPMGNEGLLSVQLQADGTYRSGKIASEDSDEPYHYQTAYLGRDEVGYEIFASACRSDGLTVTPIGPGNDVGIVVQMMRPATPSEDSRDVVGVCSLNSPRYPLAVAALTKNSSIHFSRDARSGQFVTMVSKNLRGTPYSIASSQGNIFILTSDNLYIIEHLADLAFTARVAESSPFINVRPVDAVDMAIVENKYQLLVTDNEVTLTRVEDLFQGPKATKELFRESPQRSARHIIRNDAGRRPSQMDTSAPWFIDSKFDTTSRVDRRVKSEPLVFV